ncbi:hypothetical protein PENTCL1PPCAC_17597, partial [Pristionchus entomophagus]
TIMHLRLYSMILLFMAISIEATDPKKVLIYNPFIGYYHMKFMTTIANELKKAGHNVTMLDSMVNPKYEQPDRPGIRNVSVGQNADTRKIIESGDSGLKAFWDDPPLKNKIKGFFSFYHREGAGLSRMLSPQCKDVVNSKQLENLLETEFDLAITEVFDLCGVGIFDILKPKRVILASSVPLHEYMGEKLGLPKTFDVFPTKFRLDTVPLLQEGFKAFGDREVIDNALISAFWGQNMFGYLEAAEYKIFKNRDSSFPGFKHLLKHAHSLIENVHPLLDLSKPTLNAIVPIGGITIPNTCSNLLTKEIADDLEEAKDKKKVLVSFGTVMDPKLMSVESRKNLMEAFQTVDEAVFFWKGERELIKNISVSIPTNVKIHKWLPQNDLLVDFNMDLFVSHMGIGSFTEAAYSGVPLVAVPIFVDQHYNYVCASRLGIARFVDKATLSKSSKNLADAIRDALHYKNSIANSIQLKANLEKFGDQRKKMIDHINFILSLPADSTPMAFHNYHNGTSVKLSLLSLAHLAPQYVVSILFFVPYLVFCVAVSICFELCEWWHGEEENIGKNEKKKKDNNEAEEKKGARRSWILAMMKSILVLYGLLYATCRVFNLVAEFIPTFLDYFIIDSMFVCCDYIMGVISSIDMITIMIATIAFFLIICLTFRTLMQTLKYVVDILKRSPALFNTVQDVTNFTTIAFLCYAILCFLICFLPLYTNSEI